MRWGLPLPREIRARGESMGGGDGFSAPRTLRSPTRSGLRYGVRLNDGSALSLPKSPLREDRDENRIFHATAPGASSAPALCAHGAVGSALRSLPPAGDGRSTLAGLSPRFRSEVESPSGSHQPSALHRCLTCARSLRGFYFALIFCDNIVLPLNIYSPSMLQMFE